MFFVFAENSRTVQLTKDSLNKYFYELDFLHLMWQLLFSKPTEKMQIRNMTMIKAFSLVCFFSDADRDGIVLLPRPLLITQHYILCLFVSSFNANLKGKLYTG